MNYALLGAIAGAIFVALAYLSSPSVKGARGEARVRRRLAADLASEGAVALQDLTLPTADGTTQIDHVVIARGGVFVIETKTMAGWIFGAERQAQWTQVLPGRKTRFQNPLRQNYKHIKAIEAHLGLAPEQIHSVVVFAGSARPKTEMPENVLWGPRALSRYLRAPRPELLTEAEVAALAERLRGAAPPPGRETRRAHVAALKAHAAAPKTGCPRCGGPMVARTNRKTGEAFLGCAAFPRCRGLRKGA